MEDFVPYEFVPFEMAKKLNEKGFTCEYPFAMYNKYEQFCPLYTSDEYFFRIDDFGKHHFIAPTISQVLMWLKKKKRIFVTTNIAYCYESDEIPFPTNPNMEPILKGYYYGIWELDNLNDKYGHSEYFESPELAALAGISYIIDNNLI